MEFGKKWVFLISCFETGRTSRIYNYYSTKAAFIEELVVKDIKKTVHSRINKLFRF